jgi:hypothetical protein
MLAGTTMSTYESPGVGNKNEESSTEEGGRGKKRKEEGRRLVLVLGGKKYEATIQWIITGR